MDTPMTSWPCSASRAAATEESTPPDIATTIRMEGLNVQSTAEITETPSSINRFVVNRRSRLGDRLRGQRAQLHHEPRQYADDRSEEHTSELQSLRHLVC